LKNQSEIRSKKIGFFGSVCGFFLDWSTPSFNAADGGAGVIWNASCFHACSVPDVIWFTRHFCFLGVGGDSLSCERFGFVFGFT
jgi:hypothetical protein